VKQHLNTLFVTTQGAYLRKEGEALAVNIEGKPALRIPLHHLGGICCFGRVGVSPSLMGRCAEAGVAITFLTERGRMLARVTGFTPGNVLLRREQYRRADAMEADTKGCLSIVRPIVVAKLLNSRSVLMRAVRDYPNAAGRPQLERAVGLLASSVNQARTADNVDLLRGVEGDAASTYFGVFGHLVTRPEPAWVFTGRNRRPPRDPINALLSFMYTLLMHDARSALEAAGLDSQVGFLHRDRPGRPSLALDLMEEFRAFLCDRLTVSLVNRSQIEPDAFETTPVGGVRMNDAARKTVLGAYQKRKLEEIVHPFIGESVSVGLLVHLQARLLARFLRGDLDAYPAFIWK
jgi:CRISPR-associated protein Cas1